MQSRLSDGGGLQKSFSDFYKGIILYSLCILLGYLIKGFNTLFAIGGLVSIIWLVYSCFKLIDRKWLFVGSYFQNAVLFLIVYNFIIIVRGWGFSYAFFREYLFSPYFVWPYLIPVVALFQKKNIAYKNLFDWAYYSAFIFLLISLLFSSAYGTNQSFGEQAIWSFACSSGIIILTWNYHSATRRGIAVFTLLVGLFFATLMARRNIMLTIIGYAMFAYLLYLFYYSRGRIQKKVTAVFLMVVALTAVVVVYNQKKDEEFKLITNRAGADTRDYVFLSFFRDIGSDIWFGRGAQGVYYCPYKEAETGNFVEYRNVIECGYFQLMLKGGIVGLALFLAVLLPACYLGIFKSKNGFAKACGIIVLLWLIDMGPFGLPVLSMRYIIVWLAIGICYSSKIRNFSEAQMMQLLSRKS